MQRHTDRQTEEVRKSVQSRELPEGNVTWVFLNRSKVCAVLPSVLFPQSTECVCIPSCIPSQKKAGTCIPFSQTFRIFVIHPRQGNKLGHLSLNSV